jgi:AcrR family transcriptional regulator
MTKDVRAKMIEGAIKLLGNKGLQATSFSEVIALTGAPRGSLYHHFPEGKDQLVGLAVEAAGAMLLRMLEKMDGLSAKDVTARFLALWLSILQSSQCESGCAVLAVTVATDSRQVLDITASVFRSWRLRLQQILQTGGLTEPDAKQFAATLIAACEGAVVMGRSEKSTEPFELVAEQMRAHVEHLVARNH